MILCFGPKVMSMPILGREQPRLGKSTPTNIQMSLYGAHMFRTIQAVFGDEADIGFQEKGYLILGGLDDVAQRTAAADMQRTHGADILVLYPDELRARFAGSAGTSVAVISAS